MLPQAPPPPPLFFLFGAVDGAHFPAGELLLEFFSRAHPHKHPYLNFIFILPPPTVGCDGPGKFSLSHFLWKNFFVDDEGIFLSGRRRNFLAGNPFLEIFLWGGGLFQHLKRYFYIYPLMFIELT